MQKTQFMDTLAAIWQRNHFPAEEAEKARLSADLVTRCCPSYWYEQIIAECGAENTSEHFLGVLNDAVNQAFAHMVHRRLNPPGRTGQVPKS